MNTYQFAKFISETQIDTNLPRRAVWQGREYVGDLSTIEGLPQFLGYFPLVTPVQPEPREGYHYEARYTDDGDRIVTSWVEAENPPPPPRTFSKFKLKLAIANAGFLAQFEQMLAQVEVLPGYSGAAAFADAITLDEDHPKFAAAVVLAKQEFGLTDEQVEEILAESVAE